MSHSHTFQDDHCRKEFLVAAISGEGKGFESKILVSNLEQDLVSGSERLVRSGASILPVEKSALVRDCVRHSGIVADHLAEAGATNASFGRKYHEPDFIQRYRQANRQS